MNNEKGRVSGSVLKYIVLVSMFLDHFAVVILDKMLIGYGLGDAQSVEERIRWIYSGTELYVWRRISKQG